MITQVIKSNFMNHTNCEVTDSMPTNCKNDMWTEITNICRLRSQNAASVKSIKQSCSKVRRAKETVKGARRLFLLW